MNITIYRITMRLWIGIISLVIVPLSSAQASVITNGCADASACTLEELFDGGSITVDDKLFDSWTFESLLASGLSPDFSQVLVNGLDDVPFNPGISFDGGGELAVSDTDFIDLSFSFAVSTVDGVARIKDNALILSGTSFGPPGSGGLISIDELVFDPLGMLIADKHVEQDNLFDTQILSDVAQFALQSSIFIEKDITIQGDALGNFVSLDSFEQRISQVPAPATLFLLLTGIFYLFGIARRSTTPQVQIAFN